MRLAVVFLSGLVLLGCSSEPPGIVPNHWNVINYWAIWCKPCREEIPELNQLNQIENVVVLGVNFDGKVGEALVSDAGDLGIAFDIIDDPAASLNIARPSVLPTTLILSPEGLLVVTLVGPQTAESIMAYIDPDKRPK
ncbi:MAG: TlpA disulfide reductase family protein [Pseudomonadota bacterium]|nr:TlpA disulfide reductase family protein [Pseudomonadota bacterium]